MGFMTGASGGTLEEHSRTMRRQEGRSVARRNAEWSPMLSSLRSLSIVRSQDWRGRPFGRRQSTGRRLVDARIEWSSEAAARAICPNSLRRCCCISEEVGGWLVCDRTNTLVTCVYGLVYLYGTRRMRRKHHWSKASRRCLDVSVTLHVFALVMRRTLQLSSAR